MKRLQLLGNLTRDAIVREFEGNAQRVINFDIAVDDSYTDKNGNRVDRVSYFRCYMWRKTDNIAQYLKKGTSVYVEGSPESEVYQNKQGEWKGNVKCRVSYLKLCGKPQSQNSTPVPEPEAENAVMNTHTSDDLPF